MNKLLIKRVFYLSSAIHWNDSMSSLKAVLLTGPIVRFMATEQLVSPTIASNVLIAILQGLQTHGQHDSNQVRDCFSIEEIQKY